MTNERIDTHTLTYEDLLNNPALLDKIERQGHVERAAATRQCVLTPLAEWFRRLGRHADGVRSSAPRGAWSYR